MTPTPYVLPVDLSGVLLDVGDILTEFPALGLVIALPIIGAVIAMVLRRAQQAGR